MESKRISIDEISRATSYEGYLWLSDSKEPIILDGKKEIGDVFPKSVNPFIIEGYLYDNANHSYSIKYVDGTAIVIQFTITEEDWYDNDVKEYYANRMGDTILRFLDVWSAEKDPLCLGMEVLQPQAKVFIGFKK